MPLITKTDNSVNYTFEDLVAGQFYVVSVAAKRHNFRQSSVVSNPDDILTSTDFEFEAEER